MPNDGLKCTQHEALRGSEDSVGRYGMVGMIRMLLLALNDTSLRATDTEVSYIFLCYTSGWHIQTFSS